jgi:hypothetical protein
LKFQAVRAGIEHCWEEGRTGRSAAERWSSLRGGRSLAASSIWSSSGGRACSQVWRACLPACQEGSVRRVQSREEEKLCPHQPEGMLFCHMQTAICHLCLFCTFLTYDTPCPFHIVLCREGYKEAAAPALVMMDTHIHRLCAGSKRKGEIPEQRCSEIWQEALRPLWPLPDKVSSTPHNL